MAARCHETPPRSSNVLRELDEDSDKIEILLDGDFAMLGRARPRLHLCVPTAGPVRCALKVILQLLDKGFKFPAICWARERIGSTRAS
jgi:hypothetical protein